MVWLLLGVLLWSVVHWFPALMPAWRAVLLERLGPKYMGLFALVIVFSLVLMVLGWRSAVPTFVYTPPVWGRHLTMLLILLAVFLFGAAHAPSRIRQYVRHPMLTGVAVWAFGHLLANGDSRSVVLFGGLLVWSVVSIFLINRRDGTWNRPDIPPFSAELKLLGISVVAYAALLFLHPWFAGMPLIMHG